MEVARITIENPDGGRRKAEHVLSSAGIALPADQAEVFTQHLVDAFRIVYQVEAIYVEVTEITGRKTAIYDD